MSHASLGGGVSAGREQRGRHLINDPTDVATNGAS